MISPIPQPVGTGRAAIVVESPQRVRRRPLDRDRVVAAATDLIDEYGLDQFTMRRLGELLGVEAMALYRYVAGRDDLLDTIADTFLADLVSDQTQLPGWRVYLHEMAQVVRTRALGHHEVFGLVCTRRAAATWIRPPLRNLAVLESLLAALTADGFSDTAAVSAYHTLAGFLLAHLMIADVASSPLDLTRLDRYPHVRRLATTRVSDRGLLDFDASLVALLDHIATTRT